MTRKIGDCTNCTRTSVALRLGKCSACYTWAHRHGDSDRRTGRHWTDAERNYVLYQIGYQSIPQIARALKRTTTSVVHFLENQRINPRQMAIRREGLGTRDVAQALGVARKTPVSWITRGWLTAIRARVDRNWYYTVSYDAVEQFLFERGGLFVLHPAPEWEAIYAAARSHLRARYMSAREVANLCCIAETSIPHRRAVMDFPAPVFTFNSRQGGTYYERNAVHAWLIAHPRYATPAVLRRAA